MVTWRPASRLHIQATSNIDEFCLLKKMNTRYTSSMLVRWQLHKLCLLKNLKLFQGLRCHDFSPDDTPQSTLQAAEKEELIVHDVPIFENFLQRSGCVVAWFQKLRITRACGVTYE